jgi:hypothetical protein
MLNDKSAWIKLLSGLISATEAGTLEWESRSGRAGVGMSAIARFAVDSINQAVVFRATADTATYELSSGDAFARAPFELDVYDTRTNPTKLLGSCRSSSDFTVTGQLQANQLLENLFEVVSGSVESPDELVDRLLSEIEPPDAGER